MCSSESQLAELPGCKSSAGIPSGRTFVPADPMGRVGSMAWRSSAVQSGRVGLPAHLPQTPTEAGHASSIHPGESPGNLVQMSANTLYQINNGSNSVWKECGEIPSPDAACWYLVATLVTRDLETQRDWWEGTSVFRWVGRSASALLLLCTLSRGRLHRGRELMSSGVTLWGQNRKSVGFLMRASSRAGTESDRSLLPGPGTGGMWGG